eukprot:TRINITY_DN10953_c0_g1_i1.p1 TRINITY_DN10953_c0_g1~~TRINITY_DN10953_c0_g1_i1.p1  ORF type:complete len:172 (-),score=36.35 TRINITY_DN10953_c0_g1_i1:403-918(-)
MGCNQTKQNDIQRSQEPRKRVGGGSQSSSVPVGISSNEVAKSNLDAAMLGKSKTDQREIEIDYFKNIIESTASNLIDVYTTIVPIEAAEASRHKDYTSQIKGSTIKIKEFSFSALPTISNNNNGQTQNLLSQAPEDIKEDLARGCHQFSQSVKEMKVKDCGPVIVEFAIGQ